MSLDISKHKIHILNVFVNQIFIVLLYDKKDGVRKQWIEPGDLRVLNDQAFMNKTICSSLMK
jgi:hypothetical protein